LRSLLHWIEVLGLTEKLHNAIRWLDACSHYIDIEELTLKYLHPFQELTMAPPFLRQLLGEAEILRSNFLTRAPHFTCTFTTLRSRLCQTTQFSIKHMLGNFLIP
jgi:hypothetical protein